MYQALKLPAEPVAISPPFNSPRITVQRGAFTVHGSEKAALNAQYVGQLERVVIPKARILSMRRQLRSVGITEFTLFPELDGLSRDIRAAHIDGC